LAILFRTSVAIAGHTVFIILGIGDLSDLQCKITTFPSPHILHLYRYGGVIEKSFKVFYVRLDEQNRGKRHHHESNASFAVDTTDTICFL
jgi:hypothetical protein